jgi:hypothetical protein
MAYTWFPVLLRAHLRWKRALFVRISAEIRRKSSVTGGFRFPWMIALCANGQ